MPGGSWSREGGVVWRVDEERPIGENELVRHKTRVGSPRGKDEGGQSFAGGLAVSFLFFIRRFLC